jgi:hypothetical protein
LGAMTIQGLTPGTAMLTKHLDVTYTMIWSLAIANILGAGLCLLFTNALAKIALVRIHLLAPLVIAIVFLAAFQATAHFGDIWSLLLFSLLGWFMKRFAWPRPPVILGLVLSSIIENYLYISVSRYGGSWLLRPIVIIIGLLIAGSLTFGFRTAARAGKVERNGEKKPLKFRFNPGAIFTLIVLVTFGIGVYTASDWRIQARLFPWVIGIPGLFLCFGQLVRDFIQRGDGASDDTRGMMDLPVDRSVPGSVVVSRALNTLVWILGFFAAIWLVGFVVSVPLFVLLYLKLQAGEKFWLSLAYSVSMLVLVIGLFHLVLSIPWPEGVFPQAEEIILDWVERLFF